MIESPIHHIQDIQFLLDQANSSSYRNEANEQLIAEKTRDLVHCNVIIFYFTRLSWVQKLNFLKSLSENFRRLSSLALILNTMYCVTGKISFYSKTMTKRLIPFDTVLCDHNRMMDEETVKELIKRDISWFTDSPDDDQIALFIGLMRISGGAIIETIYRHLEKVYFKMVQKITENEKKNNLIKEEEKVNSEENNKDVAVKKTHKTPNPVDPKHQEYFKVTKEWKKVIEHYRKQIKKATPKTKTKKDTREKRNGNKNKKQKGSNKGSKKGSKKGKRKKSKKENKNKPKKKQDSVDWIQLMPIYIVKKIFTYLNKKTRQKAKKVNEYWKWVIADLEKDLKIKKKLEKTIRHFKASNIYKSPEDSSPTRFHKLGNLRERKMKKLFERGAILEKLRHVNDSTKQTNDCLIIKSFEVAPYNVAYLDDIMMYKRIIRSNLPLYEKPSITCKDYNIICRNSSTTTFSDEDYNPTALSEYSSISSDEIEF